MKKLGKEAYTVGWICALPRPEWQASRLLFDGDEHENVPLGSSTHFQYAFGTMNGHNIVMGCLPDTQMGYASAAAVASEMRATFHSLRFAVLVGVGGGVPSEAHDIRLGDVVVSRPNDAERHGGVIQYDYGKAVHNGEFLHTGMLNKPPDVLLSALGKARAARPRTSMFADYLKTYEQWKEDEPAYSTPPKVDRLFKPEYLHPPQEPTCRNCDLQHEIQRPPRSPSGPIVHFGTIASGNQVMKDAAKRDAISKEQHDILCFEMEAAGLMNHFPCLVIRGICDYCDSHKNKAWQPLAAAAAAAWTKELLRNIASADVSIGDTILQMSHQSKPQRRACVAILTAC